MADIVVTEAGFAADLGAEKFFDIVCRNEGIHADCAVIVCSIRALKMHGGVPVDKVCEKDCDGLRRGFSNLDKHIENIRKFGVPSVVALNHFASDTEEEIRIVIDHCKEKGIRCALSDVFSQGGAGGIELAKQVLEVLENERPNFRFLYDTKLPLKEKIRIVATEMYGALDVQYESGAAKAIKQIETSGTNRLPVCMAKTQLSLSDNPKLKGAPTGWVLNVREVFVSAGAGFIVVVCGPIMLMPGLSSEPAALGIDISDDGHITGLY